jgi:SAM-dependent methyltransferase
MSIPHWQKADTPADCELAVTPSVVASAYDAREFEDNYPDGIENHFWNSARNDVILSYLRRSGAISGLVLDIGCGRGITLEYLRDRSVSCIGVEVGNPRLKPTLQPLIHTGLSAFDLPLPLRKDVETILLLDVIEHIEDSRAFLQKCRDAFPNLARILITVPARTELWSNYDTRFGHYRRYTRGTLQSELEGAGFHPREISYFFHFLYPVILFLARVRKRRNFSLRSPGILPLHQILRFFFNLDDRLIPRAVPGSSLIAVATVNI